MTARYLSALGCGMLFALGLGVSQMAYPAKVIGFLNVTGAWDASLLLVLGSAVAVTAIGFRLVKTRRQPWFGRDFERPAPESVDARLITGAAIFGVGWGLTGYCPGPGIVALGRFAPDAAVFVLAFAAGSAAFRTLAHRRWRYVVSPNEIEAAR